MRMRSRSPDVADRSTVPTASGRLPESPGGLGDANLPYVLELQRRPSFRRYGRLIDPMRQRERDPG